MTKEEDKAFDESWAALRPNDRAKRYPAFKTVERILPSEEAADYIREYKASFPVEAYATEVVQWDDRSDGTARVVIKRYPTAD